MRPVRRVIDRKINFKIHYIAGLTPITEFHAGDVFIVGYPRSGHTWFQNLIAAVIYGVDPEYARDTLVQELVPDVHYKQFYKRYSSPMFFKSHFLPRPDYRQVIYLLRDGRDAMVSYFHFLSTTKGREINFMKMVRDGNDLFPCKWNEHVKMWSSNPYNARIMTIKYEDLIENIEQEMHRFCAFIGIERSDPFLKNLTKKATFETMRRNEVIFGWDKLGSIEWPKDKPLIRRGQTGSYKDEMPPDVLDVFMRESYETLVKCGYC